jgi:hypothetical protein
MAILLGVVNILSTSSSLHRSRYTKRMKFFAGVPWPLGSLSVIVRHHLFCWWSLFYRCSKTERLCFSLKQSHQMRKNQLGKGVSEMHFYKGVMGNFYHIKILLIDSGPVNVFMDCLSQFGLPWQNNTTRRLKKVLRPLTFLEAGSWRSIFQKVWLLLRL